MIFIPSVTLTFFSNIISKESSPGLLQALKTFSQASDPGLPCLLSPGSLQPRVLPVKKPRDRADASLAKGESRASPGPITGNLGTAGPDWSGVYLEG